jgi:20S proteasome alpha/beta subunit
MTTLAYKDGIIAFDSRTTKGNLISDDDFNKHQVVDGVHFFLCGSVPDYIDFIKMYFGVNITSKPEVGAFVYHEDTGQLYSAATDSDGIFFKAPIERRTPESMGSGEHLALAAMDFGCTAKDAVKYAMTRDCKSGGKVRTYKLKD